jgi:hypothetical protein
MPETEAHPGNGAMAGSAAILLLYNHQEERVARESSGAVSDGDEDRLVNLISEDLLATVGAGLEQIVVEEAARLRVFCETLTVARLGELANVRK